MSKVPSDKRNPAIANLMFPILLEETAISYRLQMKCTHSWHDKHKWYRTDIDPKHKLPVVARFLENKASSACSLSINIVSQRALSIMNIPIQCYSYKLFCNTAQAGTGKLMTVGPQSVKNIHCHVKSLNSRHILVAKEWFGGMTNLDPSWICWVIAWKKSAQKFL